MPKHPVLRPCGGVQRRGGVRSGGGVQLRGGVRSCGGVQLRCGVRPRGGARVPCSVASVPWECCGFIEEGWKPKPRQSSLLFGGKWRPTEIV